MTSIRRSLLSWGSSKRSRHRCIVGVVCLFLCAANELPITEAYYQRILSTNAPTRQQPWRQTSTSDSSVHRLSQHYAPRRSSIEPPSGGMTRRVVPHSQGRLLLARRSNTQEEPPATATTSTTSSTPTTGEDEEPLISELDARVLRSMLQDQDKLDLGQEENMKRLLERGIAPKTAPLPRQDTNSLEEDDSEYSSQVFKKLTDTKLWKVLRRTTEDLVESAKIFVINRIERDAKLLASVGLFAWDRAVRDVARALPAASSKARVAVGLLTNSSSSAGGTTTTTSDDQPVDLFETLNTPLDEIKSVTQAITDILSGEVTMVDGGASSSRRRLRTLAPAGQVNNAERQRRAYERRKKTTLHEEKEVIPNIGKVVGGLADATWEMKRELQVESSQPGYKTENLRNAIEAGATQTGKLLQAVKEDGWTRALLSPLKRQKIERQLKAAVASQQTLAASAIPIDFLLNLLEERTRVVTRLKKCIEQPEATWLNVDVIQRAEGGVHFEEDKLRAVVETMIQARDEIKTLVDATTKRNNNNNNEPMSIPGIFEELRQVQMMIEEIQSKASQLIAPVVGDALFDELVGKKEATGNDPILLSLDELEDVVVNNAQQQSTVPQVETNIMLQSSSASASSPRATPAAPKESSRPQSTVVDVMPEDGTSSRRNNFWQRRRDVVDDDDDEDDAIASFQVEIVTDDDMDGSSVGTTTKTVDAVSEDMQEKEKPNLFVQLTLRSFDVVFFVLEKVVLVAVPKLFSVGKTMSTRIEDVGRSGLGRKGWQRIGFTEEGVRRY